MSNFGKFFKINGTSKHDWQTIKQYLNEWPQVYEQLCNFDYDGISASQLKMIKTAELPTEEECIRVSKALALIARITSSAQEYYFLKDR